MKPIIVFAALIVAAMAATIPTSGKDITLVKSELDMDDDGYHFGYDTSDGTSRSESAQLVKTGADTETLFVKGYVTWIAPDGKNFTLRYVADQFGFQPEGDHLPK